MSDVTDIIPPTVPASTVEFAKAVAELAKQHRIEGFTMEMRPSYGYSSKVPHDQRVSGMLRVMFSAQDGRGRPRHKLHVTVDASLTVLVVDEMDSSS